jgi:DNA polymerase III subunit gamma/tau
MSNVLYRKYRAQNFDELVGQEHITKILKNAIKSDQISHAYLLVGSRGTGKTSTARILAKAVNCKSIGKDGNPCNKCEICNSITSGNFLDLIEIDAASNRGIDQIRDLKERIEFSPTDGRFKVYIIDEVHMLTNEAFNALLKTLEEPPSHIIFILATTDAHKLPATILSRCQRYDFRLGSDEEIRGILKDIVKKEKIKVEDGAMDIIVRNARGSYRDALSLLDVVINGQTDGDKKVVTESEVRECLGIPEVNMVNELISALLHNNSKQALENIKELESKGTNLSQFVSFVLEILREVLVAKLSGLDTPEYPFANDMDQRKLLTFINAFINAERDLRNTSNQILILQLLIPTLCTESVITEVVKKKREVKNNDVKSRTIVEKKSEMVEVVCSDAVYMNVEDIKNNWKDITNKVKSTNTALSAFLTSSKVISVKEDVLNIEVPFKFHKDQIEHPNSRQLISTAINEVVGVSCRICCKVNDSVKPRIQASADVVLKNIPKIEKKESDSTDDKAKYKKKKLSADVEAIFAGM